MSPKVQILISLSADQEDNTAGGEQILRREWILNKLKK